MKRYFVYLMSSQSRILYVGVTSDLERRVFEHKCGVHEGFTKRYKVTRLVYFEEYEDVAVAIRREKQIKGWVRARKVRLIEGKNPSWVDLAKGWFKG